MANFYQAVPRTSIDSATLTTSYQPINPAGLPEACIYLVLSNLSGNIIDISYDGVTDHDVIAANIVANIPGARFTSIGNTEGVWKKTQRIWVKSTTMSAGAIYLAGYYL